MRYFPKSSQNVDMDLLAVENLITAILFYDDLIVVDDYKEEFSESRKRLFSNFRFINSSDFNIPQIKKEASVHSDSISATISGGNFESQEYEEILKKLKTQIICTWNLSSSIYYLTLNSLGNAETNLFNFDKAASAIFSEFDDSINTNSVPKIDLKTERQIWKFN